MDVDIIIPEYIEERVSELTSQYGAPLSGTETPSLANSFTWEVEDGHYVSLKKPYQWLEKWFITEGYYRTKHREDGPSLLTWGLETGTPVAYDFYTKGQERSLSEMLEMFPENRKDLLLWI